MKCKYTGKKIVNPLDMDTAQWANMVTKAALCVDMETWRLIELEYLRKSPVPKEPTPQLFQGIPLYVENDADATRVRAHLLAKDGYEVRIITRRSRAQSRELIDYAQVPRQTRAARMDRARQGLGED